MLTRKPRTGEQLDYNGRDGREIFTVERIDGDILHVRRANGSETTIIWHFHDGLNRLLSHEKDEDAGDLNAMYDTPVDEMTARNESGEVNR